MTLMAEVCDQVMADAVHGADASLRTIANHLDADKLSATWTLLTGSPAATTLSR